MDTPRISASSYSNTAPLVWSFLYGTNHGRVEMILDNAPARSAALLRDGRVDAALVPVAAYQELQDARIIPGVCVGARERVRSVCIVTHGRELADVRTVALDVSSRTSAVLTKIIFREFLGFEPEWKSAKPDLPSMLADSDAALLIGDPALSIADGQASAAGTIRKFDLAELWRTHTGAGVIFAMWMTGNDRVAVDFAAARDEGVRHIEEIVSNYHADLPLSRGDLRTYLSENITYEPDESMLAGMDLYFELAEKHGLISNRRKLRYW